jgi:hypothetical protein
MQPLPLTVDDVDHRRQRCRLARSGRPRHEYEPTRLPGELLEHGRQAELLQLRDLVGNPPEGSRDRAALEEAVDAEAGNARNRVGEVELLARLEPLPLVVVEQAVDGVPGLLRGEARVALHRDDPPTDPDRRRKTGCEMDVGCPFLRHPGDDFCEVERLGALDD